MEFLDVLENTGSIGRLLGRCLALMVWILTPLATWIAEWVERRRQQRP
jgi:hypothetical protein